MGSYQEVCQRVLPSVTEMKIDSDRNHILTNFKKVKKGGKAIDSDPATTTLQLNLNVVHEKPTKVEMFNFRDKAGQEIFKKNTSETKEFSECFMSKKPVHLQAQDWIGVLAAQCSIAFPKIRIRKKNVKCSDASKLIDKRNILLKKEIVDSKEVDKLTKQIASILEEEGRSKAYRFKQYCDKDRTLNLTEMWKLKKKLWSKKKSALPVAKRNFQGKHVTAPADLRKLLLKEYQERLRKRPNRNIFQKSKRIRRKLIQMKLKLSEQTKSDPFQMSDLDQVLNNLKSGKSRDPLGILREVFKPSNIGTDLKESLLQMYNKIKEEGVVPDFMCRATKTTIPKKGPRTEPTNERGIFLVNSVRGILMRMLFNSESNMIDSNMSDSNIGGRKNKSCINPIWVLNSIIHDQINSKCESPVLLQQHDYKQMFDSMNLKEACSDLFDIGLKNDKLKLLYNANKKVKIQVKTLSGLTQETDMIKIVMQGEETHGQAQ